MDFKKAVDLFCYGLIAYSLMIGLTGYLKEKIKGVEKNGKDKKTGRKKTTRIKKENS